MDEPIDIKTLGLLLRREREQRGHLSLRTVADQADVPFNTLARVEKGHLPDLANFRRLVDWLGVPPERFFEPSQIRAETTPDIIAYHLARDPNLTEAAAGKIAGLVRELYSSLADVDDDVRVHLRAAATFTPDAAGRLGDLLEQMQRRLTAAPTPQN